MEVDEEQKLGIEAYNLEQKLNALQNELNKVALSLIELDKAKVSLKNLKENEILAPVGAGILIKAMPKIEGAFVPIGVNYYIFVPLEEALNKIKEVEERTKTLHDNIFKELKRAEAELLNIMQKARELERNPKLN